MLPWKLRKRQILPVNHNLSSVYFSPAKFQLVSCNLSLAMIWQMTYTHKLPKLCSATLNGLRWNSFRFCLVGENIPGNFSPIRTLLVECILEDSFEERGKKVSRGENPLGSNKRTYSKLNSRMASTPGFERGPHCWGASAVTSAPSLLYSCSTPTHPTPFHFLLLYWLFKRDPLN